MTEPIRAFVAIALPQPVRDDVREAMAVLENARLAVRWVRPENVHLTLKFLGDVASSDLAPIGAAIREAVDGLAPIRLVVRGIGAFPNRRKPRVIWLGADGDLDDLADCHRRIEAALAPFGFAPEARRFKAHLTVGRSKGRVDPDRLDAAIAGLAAFTSTGFAADRVSLYRSRLGPGGARYTVIETIPFLPEI